jgi:hypothetical protein
MPLMHLMHLMHLDFCAQVAMNSAEKEKAVFESPVPVKGNVENWLSAVEAMMKRSIKMIARQVRAECFLFMHTYAITTCMPMCFLKL